MRIAYFLRSLDFLFVRENGNELFAIVPENSEEEKLAKKELNLKNILPIKLKRKKNFSEFTCEEIIKYSDLLKKLKDFKIDCLFIRNSNPFLQNWSLKNKVVLLIPSYQIQKKFENKIYFERFLRKSKLAHIKSEILNSKKTLLPFPKTVIQSPTSTGGEGTFVVNTQGFFKKVFRKLRLPLLAREYKEGLPLSSSIFIKDKKVYLTSIERQCYLKAKEENRFGLFIGIQWLPYNFFLPRIYQDIESNLLEIGVNLEKFNLSGLINLDFVLDKEGNVNFLECNPRIACATNQIMAIKELKNGKNFLKLLLSHYVKSFKYESQTSRERLPKSLFAGSQMFIYFPNFVNFPRKIKRFKPGGFFILRNSTLEKIKLNNRFDFLKLKNGLFYYNEINKGEIYNENVQIGTVISNFPLYNFETGNFNKEGEIVYRFFHRK